MRFSSQFTAIVSRISFFFSESLSNLRWQPDEKYTAILAKSNPLLPPQEAKSPGNCDKG